MRSCERETEVEHFSSYEEGSMYICAAIGNQGGWTREVSCHRGRKVGENAL